MKSNMMENNISVNNDNKKEQREVIPNNRWSYLFAKRTFDILASGIFLILFGWVILLLCFIKFCEDGHNLIYTLKRVGKGGRVIKYHKIRSMKPGAEVLKEALIAQDLNEADGPAFEMKNDTRITKFGKFLRKTILDELPQIWDIFCGRISLVGPRTPIISEVVKYDYYQLHRLDVKGGLLCLWQIQKNRNSLLFDEWVDLDIEYIEKRSIWLDIKIIFKGVWMVVFDHSGK